MDTSYNQVAGQSVERLAALSDGIFGVAMTLLLLELRVPAKELIHSEGDLRSALAHLAPQLLVYLMSFLTLGIFWVGQQTQLNHLAHSERHFTWIQLAFLFIVTIMPFSTRLLIEFIDYRTALLAYWANIFLLGAMLYLSWWRATRVGLVKSDTHAKIVAAIRRPHLDCSIVLRVWRTAVRLPPVLEHRVHCPDAALLRHRAALCAHQTQ
jgi:uncharacterized membrane protein